MNSKEHFMTTPKQRATKQQSQKCYKNTKSLISLQTDYCIKLTRPGFLHFLKKSLNSAMLWVVAYHGFAKVLGVFGYGLRSKEAQVSMIACL